MIAHFFRHEWFDCNYFGMASCHILHTDIPYPRFIKEKQTMTKGEFKCSTCSRTFSMAAHLARHTNSMHRRPGRPKGSGKGKGARGGRLGRPPLSRSGGANQGNTSDDDSRVLSEMAAYRDTLLMQRLNIDRRLEGIQSAMSVMGSSAFSRFSTPGSASRGKRRGRPPGSGRVARTGAQVGGARRGRKPGRPGSLKQMIIKVLNQRSQAQSPQEIADGVVKAGYKTSSHNLTKSVSNALPKLSEVKKLGRGLYQV
jgi:hypothetical protein